MLAASTLAHSNSLPLFARFDQLAQAGAPPPGNATPSPLDAALNAGGGGRSPEEKLRIGTTFCRQLDDNRTVLAGSGPMSILERTYREDLQSAGEMALLGMDVYLDASNPALLPAGFTALSDAQAEAQFPGFTARDDKSGFYSRVYHDANSGNHVVVNRGTNDASAPIGIVRGTPDGRTNWSLLNGNRTHQADLALRNARVVDRGTGGHVTFSGHSLGGALASLQATATRAPATVFNPLGLNNDLFAAYHLDRADFDRNVRSYVVDGEPVALANRVLGLERTSQTEKLPSREIEGEDSGKFRTSAKSEDPHSMVAVLAGLSYRYHW
jgi:Lipase (class 3)